MIVPLNVGGRFYGPWWISPNKDIRKYITLNDKKTVELDYSSLNIHLLYSEEGLNYYDLHESTADPYILKGVDSGSREVNLFFLYLNQKYINNFILNLLTINFFEQLFKVFLKIKIITFSTIRINKRRIRTRLKQSWNFHSFS